MRAASILHLFILVAVSLASSAATALTCESDPEKFAFAPETPGPTFRFGTNDQVDQAYTLLKKTIGDIGTYPRSTIFLTKGYRTLTSRYCEGDHCTNDDLLGAIEICSARAMSVEDTCYPLAVVHQEEVYCLLAPKDSDPTAPYTPYRD